MRTSSFWMLLELRVMEVVSGDNWGYNYKTNEASVKSSSPTKQHPVFTASCPSCRPTNNVRAL